MLNATKSLLTLSTIAVSILSASHALAMGDGRKVTDTEIMCISEPLDTYGSTQTLFYSGKTGELREVADYYDGTITKNLVNGATDTEVDGKIYVYGQRKAYRINLTFNRNITRKDHFNSKTVETSGGEFVQGKLVGATVTGGLKYDCKLGG